MVAHNCLLRARRMPKDCESVLGWHALRDALFACCAYLCHCSCLPFVARSALGLAAVVSHKCCAPATRLSTIDQVRFRWRRRVCIVLARCCNELRSALLAWSASSSFGRCCDGLQRGSAVDLCRCACRYAQEGAGLDGCVEEPCNSGCQRALLAPWLSPTIVC